MANTSHRRTKRVWKSVWETKALPKAKNFILRALNNAVPNFLNLCKRKISPSPICPASGSNRQ